MLLFWGWWLVSYFTVHGYLLFSVPRVSVRYIDNGDRNPWTSCKYTSTYIMLWTKRTAGAIRVVTLFQFFMIIDQLHNFEFERLKIFSCFIKAIIIKSEYRYNFFGWNYGERTKTKVTQFLKPFCWVLENKNHAQIPVNMKKKISFMVV